MTSSKPGIVAAFDALRLSLENKTFLLSPSPLFPQYANDDKRLILAIDQISASIKRYPRFFAKHNYEWALEPVAYSWSLEALYQSHILEALAEASLDHPNAARFSNVAVRFLASGIASGESIQHNQYRYLVLSTSFMKLLQEFLWLLWRLVSLGAQRSPACKIVTTSHFGGDKVETALRAGGEEVVAAVDRFLSVIWAYAGFDRPAAKPVYLVREMQLDDERNVALLSLYESTEIFVLFHELIHLLEHDFGQLKRSLTEELAADFYASSFLINHTSRHHYSRYGFLAGPALFFQLSRLLLLVRRVASTTAEGGGSRAIDAIGSEYELRTRLEAYSAYNKNWGLVERTDNAFWDIATEFYLLVAGCQIRMLQLIGSRELPGLDDLMSPR